MIRRFLIATSCLVLICTATATLSAATLTYDGGMGETTRFGLVEESSTSPNFPLFGAPTIVGDMLVFSPATFESVAENGDADITDGRLSLMVFAKPGHKITGIWVDEFGDYALVGDSALVGVGSTAFVSSGGPQQVGSFSFSDEEGLDIATPFQGHYAVDLPEPADKISIVLDNTLASLAGDVAAAFIKKKGFKLTVHTIVPEPGTLVLVGLGGLGLAALGWRRRSSHRTPHELA